MKVGFTGTRTGMTDAQKSALKALLISPQCTEFHHGDCVGADAESHDIAADLNCQIVIHPAKVPSIFRAFKNSDRILDPKRPLDRNIDIVDETDYLIAAAKQDGGAYKSGTWHTIHYARRCGKQVIIIYPSGKSKIEPARKFTED